MDYGTTAILIAPEDYASKLITEPIFWLAITSKATGRKYSEAVEEKGTCRKSANNGVRCVAHTDTHLTIHFKGTHAGPSWMPVPQGGDTAWSPRATNRAKYFANMHARTNRTGKEKEERKRVRKNIPVLFTGTRKAPEGAKRGGLGRSTISVNSSRERG